jgi:chromosome segregation protein
LHLKRLELLGFKSFASKTVLDLDKGITGIVGPNGSGKSNVVDAIRWSLGEQSLKAVRSKKSEEVIFAGNTRRAPTGMAEVTLVLDNSDGTVPLPFAEVSITRRQYRSGESEYLINKVRARLKDVVELLTHASLGPDAYAVVGQGAVDEVLLQRPEERRALLESTADISRYQMKLKESLDKLGETESNIRRVEDIQGEITPRLAKLRTQAHRAQRYEQLVRRMREMVQWSYLLQLRHAREKAAAGIQVETTQASGMAEVTRTHDASRQRVAALREQLRQVEANLEAARERADALRLARAGSERQAAQLQEREAAYKRQLSEAEEELAGAHREVAEIQAEMDRLKTVRADLASKVATARSETAPVDADWKKASSEQRMVQSQLDRITSELQGASAKRSELQERRKAAERDLARAQSMQAESQQAMKDAEGRLSTLQAQLASAQEGVDRLRADLAQSEKLQREAQARQRELGERLAAARKEERQAWEEDSTLKNRFSMLQSLKEEGRGLPAGAKTIVDAKLPGILGTLASHLRVPQQYVVAVAAALGGAQGYVVSQGTQEGLSAVEFLAKRPGRATLAPMRLDGVSGYAKLAEEFRSQLDETLHGLKFHGVASELVSSSDEAWELRARYLGLSLVVEGMDDAVKLYHRLLAKTEGRVPFQVVTMDGKLIRARGEIATPHASEKEGGLLSRESELVALSEAREKAAARAEVARATVAGLEASNAELSRVISSAAATTSRLQSEISRAGSARADLSSQVAKLEAGIEWNRTRAGSAEKELAQSKERMARTDQELAEGAVREKDGRSRADQLREDLANQRSVVSEVSAALSRLQSRVSALDGQLREQDARISANMESLQRAGARVRRQEERVAQVKEALAQLGRGPQADFTPAMQAELETTQRRVAELTERVAQMREGYNAADAELAALTEAQDQARDSLSDARSRAQLATVELAALVREAAREAELEIEQAEPETPADLLQHSELVVEMLSEATAEMPTDGFPETLAAATQKVDGLRKELHSLGTINAEAPEEYRQLSERHAFQTAQMEDLSQAERTLRKAIEELRVIMSERFQEAFNRVNEEFGICFSILFGGGNARLALTQPDQPLEGGVEVIATPPGKKGGSLLGLSGGERALTAVALLFAMMRVNPSPFCLLDEVDAALDESNVRRFCDMVRRLTDNTQFLVITHNRTTMEMAGVLYGVSMLADATSRVMSVKLAAKEMEN